MELRRVWQLLLAATPLLGIACGVRSEERLVPHLFRFDGRSLERAFSTPQTLNRVDRDSGGERLYLFPLGSPGAEVVILRADGSSTTKLLPGYVAFLGDDEQFVLWSEGDQADVFRFANGASVKRRHVLRPDYSGEYFFNASAEGTYIARSATPDIVLADSDLLAQRLFRRGGKLLLCGLVADSRAWACDMFNEESAELEKKGRIENSGRFRSSMWIPSREGCLSYASKTIPSGPSGSYST